jgi:ribosomal protein S18 acetylase RimI-like enzyme
MTLTMAGVRTARLDDVEAIAEIHVRARSALSAGFAPDQVPVDPAERAWYADAYADRVTSHDFALLCAERDGLVVGFALLGRPEGVSAGPGLARVRQLHVRPGLWRQGIGARLHGACVEAWQADGVTVARLEVAEGNGRARAFFARHGWRADGGRRQGADGASHLRLSLAVPRR